MLKKKFLIFLVGAVFLLFFAVLFWHGIFSPQNTFFSENKLFQVERGQNLFQIAENLEKMGMIKNKIFFIFYVLIKGKEKKLQAGTYLFNPSMSISQIAEKIIKGETLKEKITIIEGWNLKEIASFLERKGICKAEDFLRVAKEDFSAEFDFLKDKPKDRNLEGYLFPDTYEIDRGDKPEELIKKMLRNLDRKLTPEMREEIKKQNKTIFEIITMASIIEKEVRSLEDKEIVSGIFWKRIEEKKPLQSCATIAYIKGVPQWRYSFEDTRIESPYNTYLNVGLPFGPISNPGIDSIIAAIFPKKTEYNYFLNEPQTGKTIFSKSLEEHNLAKKKYFR